MFHLQIRKKSPDLLILDFSRLQRLFFAALTLLLIAGVLYGWVTSPDQNQGLLLFFGLATLIGTFYTEKWTFNKKTETISSKFGLLFLAKTKTYSLNELREIKLGSFIKGKLGTNPEKEEKKQRHLKPYAVLSLVFDTEVKDLEITPRRQMQKLSEKGAALAEFCDCSFSET